jgi:hypothetical protein
MPGPRATVLLRGRFGGPIFSCCHKRKRWWLLLFADATVGELWAMAAKSLPYNRLSSSDALHVGQIRVFSIKIALTRLDMPIPMAQNCSVSNSEKRQDDGSEG